MNSKRKFLTRLSLVTSGTVFLFPNKWKKPIINSVFLPAHGQTSQPAALYDIEVILSGPIKSYVETNSSLHIIGDPSGANGTSELYILLRPTQPFSLVLPPSEYKNPFVDIKIPFASIPNLTIDRTFNVVDQQGNIVGTYNVNVSY